MATGSQDFDTFNRKGNFYNQDQTPWGKKKKGEKKSEREKVKIKNLQNVNI